MIPWISDWLKQIIVVIVLAAFVDLMMPNNGLQRYVRTVLGLFILLILLTPIFTLFQKGLDTLKLTASVEELPALMGISDAGTVGVTKMKPLDSVLREGERIKTVQEQQTVQLLEARLSSELRSSMESIGGVQVKDISVELQADNNGKPYIDKMLAILHNIDEAESRSGNQSLRTEDSNRRMEPVTPVRPVQIEVRVGERKAGATTKQEDTSLSDSERQAKSKIYELLTQQWQLKRDQVQLYYESEQRKAR